MSIRCVSSVLTCAVLVAPALGGPLAPPAGPVSDTGRFGPRTELSQDTTPGDADSIFKITTPGSYYLAGNIAGVVGSHGIEIDSSGVTLDLYGFRLQGGPGSLAGVSITGNERDIAVRNGTLSAWGNGGIAGTTATAVRVGGVIVDSCVGVGIQLNQNALVDSCTVRFCSNSGIDVSTGSVVSGCVARGNGGQGIKVFDTCVVTGCVARANIGDGFTTGFGSVVRSCVSMGNSRGFVLSVGVRIEACVAEFNDGVGISASTRCVVTGCSAQSNDRSGIVCSSECRVVGNHASGNGVNGFASDAGIFINGDDSVVMDNSLTDNPVGLAISVGGCIVSRNTAGGNTTNYQIVAGNQVGVIVLAPASAAINGAVGGAGLGTTDPWANFSY